MTEFRPDKFITLAEAKAQIQRLNLGPVAPPHRYPWHPIYDAAPERKSAMAAQLDE